VAIMAERAQVRPEVLPAGSWVTFTVRYRVERQWPAGSVLRVQLPDSWHAWRRNSAKGVQSEHPGGDNYVSAHTSNGAARLVCEVEGGTLQSVVKSNRAGVDGRESRYVYVTRVVVAEGALEAGDEIEVVYGDTSAGSRGFSAALQPEGPEPVALAVAVAGDDEVALPVEHCPRIEAVPGSAAELSVIIPSTLRAGEAGELRVTVLDAEANRAIGVSGPAAVRVVDGAADVPAEIRISSGSAETPFTAGGPGVLRVAVRIHGIDEAVSNPAWVSADEPPRRVYWGDLHSHAHHSFDAVGSDPFGYARDTSRLDFYALTEHCERWSDAAWDDIRAQVDKRHEDGRFVTILAYEATFGEPWGHHNVYFRDTDWWHVSGAHDARLPELWDALRDGEAFTIPHHTGVQFSSMVAGSIPGSGCPNVDWSHHDPEFRRTVEIYSGHGQSEFYDPGFDLSYENSDFSINTSSPGPHYARDAWERGLELGVVASSDNHRAQPGRGELGLAAVRAPGLSRHEVFDAIRDRWTYGTTGARMLLDFAVNGVRMGGHGAAADQIDVEVLASGTDNIASVELFAFAPGERGSVRLIRRWTPGARDVEVTHAQRTARRPAGYYVRVRQKNAYRGRIPTAWSSPVWLGGPFERLVAGTDHPAG
jgi:hypothetical protein